MLNKYKPFTQIPIWLYFKSISMFSKRGLRLFYVGSTLFRHGQ